MSIFARRKSLVAEAPPERKYGADLDEAFDLRLDEDSVSSTEDSEPWNSQTPSDSSRAVHDEGIATPNTFGPRTETTPSISQKRRVTGPSPLRMTQYRQRIVVPQYPTRKGLIQDIQLDIIRPEVLDALDVMGDHLFKIGLSKRKKWFRVLPKGSQEVATGVTIRAKADVYRSFPPDEMGLDEFEVAVRALNPEVAFKIQSEVVTAVIERYISSRTASLPLTSSHHLQILPTLAQLPRAKRHSYAAIVVSDRCLVVWSDSVDTIVKEAEDVEAKIMDFIWREGKIAKLGIGHVREEADMEDGARTDTAVEHRQVMLYAPIIDGLAIVVLFAVLAAGVRTIFIEICLDGNYVRLALLPLLLPLSLIAMFFCLCIVSACFQSFGPVSQYHANSLFYSGIAPSRSTLLAELPHFTIQMPVYKEGLAGVIMPTVESLKKAITTYERQGGSASILISDDGLRLLPAEEAEVRKRFYHENSIGWVARPGHSEDGYFRAGRFKKASNLNFTLSLSLRVEELLDSLRPAAHANKSSQDDRLKPGGGFTEWIDDDESELYNRALQLAIDESKGRLQAGGDTRIGKYILLVDSDTRVPEDCLLDAAGEFQDPSIAIIQHESDVMQVAFHYFENGIAHFTRQINKAISFCCANGEVSPFVGHNAFLRWSAIQEVAFVDPEGISKIWSEAHVSEDFDMAVRLQMKGYILRWSTYSNGGFKEGVSLTCDDELNRWQKYAYGCSELLFFPIIRWPMRGIFTPLIKKFLWSSVPLHCKISTLSYIFSYYAISSAWFLTILSYFIVGFNLSVDGFYLTAWEVTLACLLVFSLIGNVAYSLFAYRLKLRSLLSALGRNFKWLVFFFTFFNGLSFHTFVALCAHLVEYDMTWAATLKEVDISNFFKEVPRIWHRFWLVYTVMGAIVIMMIVLSSKIVPEAFRVTNVEAIVPMSFQAGCHILYPILLNPWLMHFQF